MIDLNVLCGMKGKSVMVTGATSGLGAGIAKFFASAGVRVMGLGRNERAGQAVVDEITAAGGDAVFQKCDVTKMADCVAAAEAAQKRFGRIDCLVNCAGMGSADIHNSLCEEKLTLIPRRGQYHLLDRLETLPFSRTMFQCPTQMGKGVLVSPTVHGNLLLGPSAEDIDDPQDVSTTAEGLEGVLETCRLTWPQASVRGDITNFAGIRAHEVNGDFIIGAVPGQTACYETVGIESPGLSAAPAIAERLGAQIAGDCALVPKTEVPAPVPLPRRFAEMTDEERARAVAEDPAYGNVICRCEVVTEAEIRQAIRRSVGACSCRNGSAGISRTF